MHERSTRQRLGRRLASLLLIAGGLTLAFPFWSAAYTHYQQRHLSSDYGRASAAFAAGARARSSTLAALHTPAMRARRLAGPLRARPQPGDPIGRLIIPRLGSTASSCRATPEPAA